MSKPIVGRDVVAYQVTGYGLDTTQNSGTSGVTFNLFATWKEIEITITPKWVDRTPSGASWEVMRRTTRSATAKLKNIVREGQPYSVPLALNNDYLYVTFTDAASGASMYFFGGIDEGSQTWGADGSDENMSLKTVGTWNGGDPVGFL